MKWRAFTLVELLVVIGIITILTAIVIPALTMVRKYARATSCSSNIRKIDLFLVDYDLKNENFPYSFFEGINIPAPQGGFLGNFRYDTPGLWWINYISDLSRNNSDSYSAFWCPSRRVKGELFMDNILVGNYGVNQSICKSRFRSNYAESEFNGLPLSSTDIQFPSQTLLITDSGYALINWHHVTDIPPTPLPKSIEGRSYIPGLSINKNRTLRPELEDDAIDGRHLNKTVNIGFADGHIERKKAEDLFVGKTSEDYKNLKPLWISQKK